MNDLQPIRVKVDFFIPNCILNMRCYNEYFLKLLVWHYGPEVPHARFRINGKQSGEVYEVPERLGRKPVKLLIDLDK